MNRSEETNKCPICGKTDLAEFDICPVCLWENDLIQRDKPDFAGGANQMSVEQARIAYQNGRPVK